MRLHPPTTILVLVGIFLGTMSIQNRVTDCAYKPDGSLRWSNVADWFIDPDYNRTPPYRIEEPPCDVWKEITPVHPIGTVELGERTNAGGSVLARIEPDGSGFVAITSPIAEVPGELDEEPSFVSLERIQKTASVFEIERDPQLRTKIESLVGPMRSFRGGSWLTDDPEIVADMSRASRALFQLDDKKIRKIKCRRRVHIVPWLGEVVTYGSTESGGDPRIFIWDDCNDIAYRGAAARLRKAYHILVEAAGARAAIEEETWEKYPECNKEPWPCPGPLL